jgi:hypothetical protein
LRTLPLADLDAVARNIRSAQEDVSVAAATGPDDERARALFRRSVETLHAALARLEALGATIPGVAGTTPTETPLHLLDTPASRRLLAALEEAAKAGADVDRERGWMHDGEPAGYGETLGGMAMTLRIEVVGPVGRE